MTKAERTRRIMEEASKAYRQQEERRSAGTLTPTPTRKQQQVSRMRQEQRRLFDELNAVTSRQFNYGATPQLIQRENEINAQLREIDRKLGQDSVENDAR
ncbi:MAG: hypothetical protein OXS35_05560 [Dehalococcoidia bacterium]|nr:hypothetical protein [Dehalococcoidia bacterium]